MCNMYWFNFTGLQENQSSGDPIFLDDDISYYPLLRLLLA